MNKTYLFYIIFTKLAILFGKIIKLFIFRKTARKYIVFFYRLC